MALITMACYDTEENGRTTLTAQTLESLYKTVDFARHKIILVNNNSCEATDKLIDSFVYRVNEFFCPDMATAIHLPNNIGTARAINLGWSRRQPGQHCIKIDNDVVIHSEGWADEMEHAIAKMPSIGIIGLKRKDLIECTDHQEAQWRSELIQLPHLPGERWVVIEAVKGVMGTCKMVNSKLIDTIGYLSQPTVYGFDDSIYSCRSSIAGFINCFLPHIEIDHIDPGGDIYTEWKRKHAGDTIAFAQQLIAEYQNGTRPIYEPA
jgi:glycosyltransferase involved in cell wall biosynthesis